MSKLAPGFFQFLDRFAKSPGTLVALALAFTLAFAELADAAKLAPIVGAFVAGLALSRSSAKDRIERELAPVGHLFIPVFFLGIGIDAQVETFVKPEVLGIAAGLLVVAIIGKIVAAVGVFGSPGDKWLIGLGMIPRGEVGLIFATIGLNEGILGGNLYAALLLVVLVTTLMTPPLLRWRLNQMRSGHRARPESHAAKPEGGWLEVDDGVVDLVADPPAQLALDLSLDAARAIAQGARPGSKLLDWIGEWSDTPLRWNADATKQLFAVLVDGDARAWRFLETTGVLERTLPELAEAVDRRRSDPFLHRSRAGPALLAGGAHQGAHRDRRDRGPGARRARASRVAAARGVDPRHRRRRLVAGRTGAPHLAPPRPRCCRRTADRDAGR